MLEGAEALIMTATPATHLTFEEFELLPDQPGKLELLRGELIEVPPAKRRHNEIAKRIFVRLLKIAGSPDLGEPFQEMGYRLKSGSWLQPDVSITHRGQAGDDYYMDSPALAVEVVSDSNSAEQIEAKIEEYLSNGALEVWVVYPKQRRLWVYRPSGIAKAHSAEFQSNLLGGATVNVAEFLQDD